MNESLRNVKFSTKVNILKRKPISMLIGFLSTIIPLFIVLVLLLIFSIAENDTPKIDYDLINKKGREITAVIIDIENQNNITINGVHPTIISYKYSKKGIKAKYKTLSKSKTEEMKIGDKISIKEFKGNSIILGIKPYDFSLGFFFIIPIPFFLIGLPFLLVSITNLRRELKLYKYGKVMKGKIISMIPKSGLPVSNVGQGIIVHYEYKTINGKKIIGESFTTDFSILSDKRKDDFISIFVSLENEEKSCAVPKLESLRNNWNIEV
jgi:hypothetical protein